MIITPSGDGSLTAFNEAYGEHYHSTKDGALNETLIKHITPSFKLKSAKKELYILDICFGLGYNTLATIWYFKKYAPNIKLHIYSPELDEKLVNSLTLFDYPKEFDRAILKSLVEEGIYEDNALHLELYLGDAIDYIGKFENFFDIVYQDAFSPVKNPTLWSYDWFKLIAKATKEDAILTSYSTSFATRYNLYRNGFLIYDSKNSSTRDSLVASKVEIEGFKRVDMEHKIRCNL